MSWMPGLQTELFCSSGTLVMRPAGNENKGAMKLRVDFKQKKTGNYISD